MSGIAEIYIRDLELYRKMVARGILVTIPAALQYCLEHKLSVPQWLLEASIELHCHLLKSEKPHRRGRTATQVAQRRQDMIDYSRWGTVISHKDAQQELLREVQAMNEFGDIPFSYREDREKLLAWLGGSLTRAFECSAMLLEGTEAFGSAEAIKRSYFKVERNMRNPKEALRYGFLDPMFMHERLGIKWEPFVRPGRKIEPLYNLKG